MFAINVYDYYIFESMNNQLLTANAILLIEISLTIPKECFLSLAIDVDNILWYYYIV